MAKVDFYKAGGKWFWKRTDKLFNNGFCFDDIVDSADANLFDDEAAGYANKAEAVAAYERFLDEEAGYNAEAAATFRAETGYREIY